MNDRRRRGRNDNYNRGGRGNGRSGGRNYNNRRNSRDPRAAAHSGNKRERIAVESGYLVMIDQFMLANPQFNDRLLEIIDEDPIEKDRLIAAYGGTVVELNPGTYRIERDPYKYSIVVHQEGTFARAEDYVDRVETPIGHVFVDTRCLAMIDRELLDDSGLLDKYQQLWASGQEKACRDLLRDNGGAVRYGFHRFGDELGVYNIADEDIVCLWPDVAESAENMDGAGAED